MEVSTAVGVLLASYRAACRSQGTTLSKAFLAKLEHCMEEAVHVNQMMFREDEIDGRGLRSVVDAFAGYPPLKNLSFLRCSLGETGIATLANLLKAGACPFTRGPRLRLLQIICSSSSSSDCGNSSAHSNTQLAHAHANANAHQPQHPRSTASASAPATSPSLAQLPSLSLSSGSSSVAGVTQAIAALPTTALEGSPAAATAVTHVTGRPPLPPPPPWLEGAASDYTQQQQQQQALPWGLVPWLTDTGGGHPPFLPPQKISPTAMAILSQPLCLPTCPLRSLALDHNDIGDEGVKVLTTSLLRNSSLQALSLSYNAITSTGAGFIAECLSSASATKLLQLNLQGNPLGGPGLEAIGRGLASPSASLAILNLSSIGLSARKEEEEDRSHVAIFAALLLHNNNSLKTLDLRGNELSQLSTTTLVKLYREKETLTHVRLPERVTSAAHLEEIGELMFVRNKKVKRKGVKKKKK